MAVIRLRRREAERRLPPVCMVCGEPTDLYIRHTMAWNPAWLYVLLGLMACLLQKRMKIRAPMCVDHRNHWFARTMAISISLLVLIFFVIVWFMIAGSGRRNDNVLGLACVGVVMLALAWLVLAAVLHLTSIRPREIQDFEMTLIGVSPVFVDAVRDARRAREDAEDEEDEEYFRRRRRRGRRPVDYEDDEEDDRPRRRRAPPDAFEDRS